MNIPFLGGEINFPSVEQATGEGIVAIGGDLSPERLLKAYASGIFPWYSQGDPIIWWSPDPRMVILPQDIHISKSMKKVLQKKSFSYSIDRVFPRVIRECQQPRDYQDGTWITNEMLHAYINLHHLGYAHSVEVWEEKKLVGGLYGLSLGVCFFGESMFSKVDNASKFALIKLNEYLVAKGFVLLDCQVSSPHLLSLGAQEMNRSDYMKLLKEGLKGKTHVGQWT